MCAPDCVALSNRTHPKAAVVSEEHCSELGKRCVIMQRVASAAHLLTLPPPPRYLHFETPACAPV
eukprot:356728-Chlamydomonas_euryale.AAC.3